MQPTETNSGFDRQTEQAISRFELSEKRDSRSKSTTKIWRNNGGYMFFRVIKNFFSNPDKQVEKYLPLIDTVVTLVQSETAHKEENINATKEFLKLHRLMENTKARRRLERWAVRLTCSYLVTVALIVICNAMKISISIEGQEHTLSLSDGVIITLLSTTTVNVLGLAVIMMKGMFPTGKEVREG